MKAGYLKILIKMFLIKIMLNLIILIKICVFSKMILMIDYANQNMVHKDFCLEDIVIVLKSNITIFSLKGRRHLKISLHCLFSRRSKNYANKVS